MVLELHWLYVPARPYCLSLFEFAALPVAEASDVDVWSAAVDKLFPSVMMFCGAYAWEMVSAWSCIISGSFDSVVVYWSDWSIVGASSSII